jgi:DNA-binding CsgD family transcriptional regulator
MKKKDDPSLYHKVVLLTKKAFSGKEESQAAQDENSPIPELDRSLLNSIYANSPTVSFIYNHQTLSYDYFSPNIKDVMGYENTAFQEGGLKFAMSLVHPDHTKIYNRYVIPVMFKYFTLYGLKRRVPDLKFSYTFKIKRKNGDYMWALHHMNTIQVNSWGMPRLTLVNISDITEIKKDENVDIAIFLKGENSIYKPIYSRVYESKNCTFSFSGRELDVLSLLGEGKTSKQIALDLNISHHTVISHRKNMLKKSKVKNGSELIRLAFTKGFIKEGLTLD